MNTSIGAIVVYTDGVFGNIGQFHARMLAHEQVKEVAGPNIAGTIAVVISTDNLADVPGWIREVDKVAGECKLRMKE